MDTMNNEEAFSPNFGEIVLYQPDKTIRLEVRVENETVWLTQMQMSKLFDRDKSVISRHITNIFKEEELFIDSTVANFATVQNEGDRMIERFIEHFSLDVIISVGYRVKSKRGTQFRQWANRVLKDYLLKGFVINQRIERVENIAIETQQRVCETNIKLELLSQYIEDVLADNNDINEDTRMQLELINQKLAELQTNKIWIDKPQNPMLN